MIGSFLPLEHVKRCQRNIYSSIQLGHPYNCMTQLLYDHILSDPDHSVMFVHNKSHWLPLKLSAQLHIHMYSRAQPVLVPDAAVPRNRVTMFAGGPDRI